MNLEFFLSSKFFLPHNSKVEKVKTSQVLNGQTCVHRDALMNDIVKTLTKVKNSPPTSYGQYKTYSKYPNCFLHRRASQKYLSLCIIVVIM